MVDSTLFILFGRGIDGTFSSYLITIDVTSASNIVYTSSYTLSIDSINNAAGNGTSTGDKGTANSTISPETPSITPSNGLSAGAIGGIGAGGAIIVSV